ncbi:MAG: T9SS type A sorting domain-containing protein [Bacteroidota bacterium]|nr:T9SS type A sorting domain-containing protein [Bacteroidota bacterium]
MKKILFPVNFIVPSLIMFFLLMLGNVISAQDPVVTYTNPGDYTYTVPSFVTEIKVEAWGAGGKGASTVSQTFGAGGGGGAYVMSLFTVTPGTEYDLHVGAGSSTTAPGSDSWFDSNVTLLAKGGLSAGDDTNDQVGGQTGSIGPTGATIYQGGMSAMGEKAAGFTAAFGGGGGSSAGTLTDGEYTSQITTRLGASDVYGAGSGGDGGLDEANGSPGGAPGGGGGGAAGTGYTGGSGADGWVRISYSVMEDGTWTGDAGDGAWETAGNWHGGVVPDGSMNVIIPDGGDANITLSGPLSPAICSDLTIDPGGTLTVNAGMCLTVNGTLTNNGTLNLNSDDTGIASLMVDTYVGVGTNNTQLYLTGNEWHYVSSPVPSIPETLFSNRTETAINGYFENLVTTDYNTGWVSSIGWHYNPSSGEWDPAPDLAWDTLEKGKGYNYYSTSTTSPSIIITGTPNTAGMNISLKYNSAAQGPTSPDYPDTQGNNFLGNPFTCGIDWNVVFAENNIWSLVEATIYFKRNDITYTYSPGTGETVPDDFGEGNEIPPMHGFFIKANSQATLTLPASSKIHTGHARYKSKSIIPLVRLELENSGNTDQTLIAFNNNATLAFDNIFDARKLFAPTDIPNISSSLKGAEYAINAVPFPENTESIPLVINAVTEGQYTITAKEIRGLENYEVYLLDKEQNFKIDLTDNKTYAFASSAGMFTDRFELVVSDVIKAIPENLVNKEPFNIYSTGKIINIQTLSDVWNGKLGYIRVFDMTGRIILNQGSIRFSVDETRQLPLESESGIYFVQINFGQMKYVNKIFIK